MFNKICFLTLRNKFAIYVSFGGRLPYQYIWLIYLGLEMLICNKNVKFIKQTTHFSLTHSHAWNVQIVKLDLCCWQQWQPHNFSLNVSCFCPILKIQRLDPFKISIVSEFFPTIALKTYCFGALSQICAIVHCVIDRKWDLVWPDWLTDGCELQRMK